MGYTDPVLDVPGVLTNFKERRASAKWRQMAPLFEFFANFRL
jgi:hypothetical protein